MRTLALTIAYDGTDWAGMQRQTRCRTIQGELEAALTDALQHPVHIAAAGRTDAGVHAVGQVISLHTENPMPVSRLPRVINRLLPPSIRVRGARECPPGFHARRSASYRRYWYILQPCGQVDPLRGRFRWQVGCRLDEAAMRTALTAIRGRHDFAAFCNGGSPVRHTLRTLQRAEIVRRGDCLIVDLQADAFLHQMVRLIIANLVLVGRGEHSENWLLELLQSRDRYQAGKGAPPCGLVLMRIGYPPSAVFDDPLGDMIVEC